MSVTGLKKLEKQFGKAKAKYVKGYRRGLIKAGLFLQREAMLLCPVDKGVLRATANTRHEGEGADIVVIVSFGTNYAIFVHEDLNAKHKPGKQAKFLEQPFREKHDRMMEIINEEIEKEKV